MQYAIIYNSITGNTAQLAEKIKSLMPQSACIYCGAPTTEALDAPMIFVGFCTWKGSCTDALATFLKTIQHKQLFLFGTAGYGQNEAYFTQILTNVQSNINATNHVMGTYMCQGKMPLSVRDRYKKMLAQQQDEEHIQEMIHNFDEALQHPNNEDLTRLAAVVQPLLEPTKA